MNTQAENNVNFYQSITEIGVMKPYAVISSQEWDHAIKRLVSWATMIASHPNLVKKSGEANTAHITLATSLRTAVKKSTQDGIFRNLILPTPNFAAAMTLIDISRELEPKSMQ